MGEVKPFLPPPDPESICTRVVARVIQELSCIDVAPDSPAWSDLTCEGTKVGQLAVYRGRSGIERMVTFDVRVEGRLEAHLVAVMTDPQSLLPHLLVRTLSIPDATDLRVDLMPRLELSEGGAYVECCYTPLDEARRRAQETTGCRRTGAAKDSSLTPWATTYVLTPENMRSAAQCVNRYTDHWARLMRQGAPYTLQQAAAEVDLERRNRELRERSFRRDVDPLWAELDRVLGVEMVEMLLSALRG